MIYWQYIRFLLPLALTIVVQGLTSQFVNGGMARLPRATETLAAFGLAWGLVMFLTSPLMQVKQLSLVLVDGRYAFRKVHTFTLVSSVLLCIVIALMARPPLGDWVIGDLHGIERPLRDTVFTILLWLSPVPLLRNMLLFYTGLLMRVRRTDVVSTAILSNIGVSVTAVFLLLPLNFVQTQPIRLPILITYAGTLVELVIILWGHQRYIKPGLIAEMGPQQLTIRYILRFFWPLALIMVIQGFSRPLINLFIAREVAGAQALAVLTVVYALGHLPYGWLNEIRNLAPAFHEEHGLTTRRFAIACTLLSFSVMLLLFWTPLRLTILRNLLGLEEALIGPSRVPLMIFSFFPLMVAARAYLHGIGLIEHRTQAMAPSAPSRVLAILIALLVLPLFGVMGATRAVAALYAGFVVETAVVWWGIRGRQVMTKKLLSANGD